MVDANCLAGVLFMISQIICRYRCIFLLFYLFLLYMKPISVFVFTNFLLFSIFLILSVILTNL